MATLDELHDALINADKAGDTQAATALANEIYRMQPQQQQRQPEQRGFVESLGRQAGLTARAAVGGIGGIANAVADPVVRGINSISGANLPIPSDALERTMTRFGLPQPASGTEQFAQAVSRGMVAPAAIGMAAPSMAANIGTQIAASGMGAGSADLARQAGAGPLGQTVAGVVGGIGLPVAGATAIEAGKAATRGVGALAQPLSAEGRRMIAARAYQGAASDKDAAAQAAIDAPQYVPGSVPTTAQASGDLGLAGMEKALRNKYPEDFATRAAQQDAARQSGLANSFGNATDLQMAERARDDITAPLRQAAFENARPVDVTPIVNTTKTVLKSGPGARQEVERAMAWVQDRLKGETDPERIYAVRQDINDIIAGKMRDPEKASYQLAAGQLKAVKAVLDQQLEKAAPGFKNYLSQYADRSRAIDAVRTGQEIASKSVNPLTDTLSAASFARNMENRGEDVANMGAIGSDVLSRVNRDLKRASAPMASMRSPGSDTTQNLIAQNILGSAIGKNPNAALPKIANRALGWAYSPFEDQVQRLMLSGALNPQEGAALLHQKLPVNEAFGPGLLGQFMTIPYAGLLGLNVQ